MEQNRIRLESLSKDVALGRTLYLSVLICQMGRRISAEAVEKGNSDKACERRRSYHELVLLSSQPAQPFSGPPALREA